MDHDIKELHDDLQRCYTDLLSRNRDARGRIETRFVIAPDGTVSDACITDATLNDQMAANCVLRQFSSLQFGSANGYVTVVYPIRFSP
jgi:hypothetical protein